MKKLYWMLPLVGMLFVVNEANACPECVCDCEAKCVYGEVCKDVKECTIYETCKVQKVCSYEKKECGKDKVTVCHLPPGNPSNAHTICISENAVQAHLNHGDYLGKCNQGCENKKVCNYKKCCKYVKKCNCRTYNSKCPPCVCKQDAGVPDVDVPDAGVSDVNVPVSDVDVPDAGVPVSDVDVPDAEVPDAEVSPDAGPNTLTIIIPKMIIPNKYIYNTGEISDAGAEDATITKSDSWCSNCPPGSVDETEVDDFELVGGGGCSFVDTRGHQIGVALGLFLLIIALFRMSKMLILFSIVLIIMSFGWMAYAAPAPPVGNFKTAPSTGDYFTTMKPKTLGHLDFNTQLVFNYAHKPLRTISKTGETLNSVIDYRFNADLAISLGLLDVFELSLVVPTTLYQGAGNLTPLNTSSSREDFQHTDIKDLRVVPRVYLGTLFGSLSFGVAAPVSFPTGERNRLLGENGATVSPTLLVGIDAKYFNLGLNAGVLFRSSQEHEVNVQEINFSNEFNYGVGLEIPVVKNQGFVDKLSLIGDAWGSLQLAEQDKEEVSVEAMGGLRGHFKYGIVASVGAGGGITKGYGVPEYRVMWGIGWEFDRKKPEPCPTCGKCVDCLPPEVVVEEKVVTKIVRKTLVIPTVYFDTDQHDLRPDTIKTLDETIRVLKENSWIKKIRLEGHCDHRANDKYNEALGWRRVYAVRNYLLDRDIKIELEARSYGETQPVRNDDEDLQENRRVEFHIVEVVK